MLTTGELLRKYDVPVPRYTSYPTVPYWSDQPTTADWTDSLERTLHNPAATWSLYLHIPFCETLCTFCGCNTMITKSHAREHPYVETLLREFALYRERLPELKRRPLRQMHLGGGTPTFLSARHLDELIGGILKEVVTEQLDGSFEVDPRRTNVDQLEVMFRHGFHRISLGVQDFDPEVQRVVNRVQPLEITRDLTEAARRMGYESVNFDLIYGLPKQTLPNFERSIEQTIELRPDRIALYSFALVPWIKPQQRLFKDEDLPAGALKRELYEMSYRRLIGAGYVEIGMDHFALPDEALAIAQRNGELHRNFMGYTERRTDILLGLGVSSISETPDCFHQNEKVLPVFEKRIAAGEIATLRGHKLSVEDRHQREQILRFMTLGEVELESPERVADVRAFLADMFVDELVEIHGQKLSVTTKGKPFLRNACVALDQRLRTLQPTTKIFSKAL